jgi:hypothetical protein
MKLKFYFKDLNALRLFIIFNFKPFNETDFLKKNIAELLSFFLYRKGGLIFFYDIF